MSMILSIPPAIVQEVREWAEEHGTSLNQYIRECLEAKCAELKEVRKTRRNQFLELARTHEVSVPQGWRRSRDDATEREMECVK